MTEEPYEGPPAPPKEYFSVVDVIRAARRSLEQPEIKSVRITKLDGPNRGICLLKELPETADGKGNVG